MSRSLENFSKEVVVVIVLLALKEMGNTPVSSYFIVGERKGEG